MALQAVAVDCVPMQIYNLDVGADMGFYFRKSVKAGPFRFNFSKGGMGMSVGVRGLRIGTGPRGHYIHAGAGGLYYRGTIGRAGEQPAPSVRRVPEPSTPPLVLCESDVVMTEIESGEVLAMRDQAFGAVLDDLNAKQRQTRMSTLLGLAFGLVGAVVGAAIAGEAARTGGVLLGAMAFLPGMLIGRWQDSYRRVSVLLYDLEKDSEIAYERLGEAFGAMTSSHAKWHVGSSGQIRDTTTWKRNAGASSLVTRKATALAHALPSVIRSNVSPPSMQVGRQTLYFMPDVVLIEDGSQFGAVGYAELGLESLSTRFIEDGSVPKDAEIVDHTWAHPNKSGGPDRRFKNNRQIPVCRYNELHLTSPSGLNELLQFSKPGASDGFRSAASAMRPGGSSAPKRAKAVKDRLSIG